MIIKRLTLNIFFSLLMLGVFIADIYAKESVKVNFETSMGSFTLELLPDKAPKTVANFLAYVDKGFYDNTLFHRVIPGFVIQGGGFESGMKQKKTQSPIKNESDNGLRNVRGSISMARTSNPHSATSQFFINVVDNSSLDPRGNQPGYAVFGKISDGMDVIDKIVAVPTTSRGQHQNVPKEDVVVVSAKRKK